MKPSSDFPAFPECPTLPPELTALATALARAWMDHPSRPAPPTEIFGAWKNLLDDWISDGSVPLYIRKNVAPRGSIVTHATGRQLIVADNSPAHWSFTLACSNQCPTIEQVSILIRTDQIPVRMLDSKAERATAVYHRTLNKSPNVMDSGWKLAHRTKIGLNTKTPIDQLPITTLEDHLRSFLDPANLFVVPKQWAGLAELPELLAIANTHP